MSETGAIAGYIELLQACFPTLRVERYVPLGEGWDSVALLVNDQDVFRFAKRPDAAVRQASLSVGKASHRAHSITEPQIT